MVTSADALCSFGTGGGSAIASPQGRANANASIRHIARNSVHSVPPSLYHQANMTKSLSSASLDTAADDEPPVLTRESARRGLRPAPATACLRSLDEIVNNAMV